VKGFLVGNKKLLIYDLILQTIRNNGGIVAFVQMSKCSFSTMFSKLFKLRHGEKGKVGKKKYIVLSVV